MTAVTVISSTFVLERVSPGYAKSVQGYAKSIRVINSILILAESVWAESPHET